MPIAQLIPSFNAGELSPLLDARTDIDKYASGCRELQNFIPTPYGPNMRRPGTELVGAAKVAGKKARLIPFVFSETARYQIELGEGYMRFWDAETLALVEYGPQPAWVTAAAYAVGDLVTNAGVQYRCLAAHTAGAFATDLAADRWEAVTIQEVATPWLEADLPEIQYVEINDLAYFTHPRREPYLLRRTLVLGSVLFTGQSFPYDYPPFLEENTTETSTIQPSDTTGAITLTASAPTFQAGQVGGYFQLAYERPTSSVQTDFSANGSSSTIRAVGGWTLNTYGLWAATLTIERSYDNGVHWTVIRSFISNSDRNISTTGSETQFCLLRLTVTNRTVGTSSSTALLELDNSRDYGVVKITGVTDAQHAQGTVTRDIPATLGVVSHVSLTLPITGYAAPAGPAVSFTPASGDPGTGAAAVAIMQPVPFLGVYTLIGFTITSGGANYSLPPDVNFLLPNGTPAATGLLASARAEIIPPSNPATSFWAEGAWSDYQGFPRAVSVHEDRVYYAGTALKPQSIWGTQLDDFQNFRTGPLASDGLYFTIASARSSSIQWLQSKDGFLHVGREGGEGRVNSSEAGTSISPSDIQWTPTTSYGSKHLPAVILSDALLFVQGQGRKVRALAQVPNTAAFSGQDVTILSEHITQGGIVEYAAQSLPDAILWCVRADGMLLGMSYDSLSSVVAWHRHQTVGTFESVSVIPGQYGDEVWFVVRRRLGAPGLEQTRRFVERFRPGWREAWENEQKSEWWYLDCAARAEGGGSGTTFEMADHLAGMSVRVLADGADMGLLPVSDEGIVTLPAPASIVTAGLSYESILRPMKLEAPQQNGTAQGRKARICRMVVRLLKTLGGQYSTDGVNYADIPFRAAQDALDQSPPVFSGNTGDLVDRGNHRDSAEVWLKQSAPMPFTVLSIVPKWTPAND
jgi:hypothetical protein